METIAISIQEKECAICLCSIDENDIEKGLQCNHYFHNDCINEWIISTISYPKCPLCRKTIYSENRESSIDLRISDMSYIRFEITGNSIIRSTVTIMEETDRRNWYEIYNHIIIVFCIIMICIIILTLT